jgi:hypothetical protein
MWCKIGRNYIRKGRVRKKRKKKKKKGEIFEKGLEGLFSRPNGLFS